VEARSETVAAHRFDVRRRGYDRFEVDAVMRRVATALRRHEDRTTELETALEDARLQLEAFIKTGQDAERERNRLLFEARRSAESVHRAAENDAGEILGRAHRHDVRVRSAVAELEARATNDAARMLEDARHRADQVRHDARSLADASLHEARADARAIVEKARREAASLRSRAEAKTSNLATQSGSLAVERLSAAREEAAQVLAEARSIAALLEVESQETAVRRVETAQRTATSILADARVFAAQIVADARGDAALIRQGHDVPDRSDRTVIDLNAFTDSGTYPRSNEGAS
jgi:DivIVA domain-containing protein